MQAMMDLDDWPLSLAVSLMACSVARVGDWAPDGLLLGPLMVIHDAPATMCS